MDEFRRQVVQLGTARIPQNWRWNGQGAGQFLLTLREGEMKARHLTRWIDERQADANRQGCGPVQFEHDLRLFLLDQRRDVQPRNMRGWAHLQEDALPDTADGPVPTLLPVRNLAESELGEFFGIVARVDDTHDEFVEIVVS